MSNTDSKRQIQAAELQLLTARLYSAIQKGQIDSFREIRGKINEFILRPGVWSPLQRAAEDVVRQAGNTLRRDALDEIAEVADRVSLAGSGLEAATKVAQEGQEELFFPTVAATLARTATILEALGEAANNMRDQLSEVEGLEDLPEAVRAVIDQVKSLEEKIEAGTSAMA